MTTIENAAERIAELKAQLADLDALVARQKEVQVEIAELKYAAAIEELNANPCNCQACMFHSPDTAKEFMPRGTRRGTGRPRGEGGIPVAVRRNYALAVGKLRLENMTQSQIGKTMSKAFPEIYAEGTAETSSATRHGTEVGQILRNGGGAWAEITGFDTKVSEYALRSEQEIAAMVERLQTEASVEDLEQVETIVAGSVQ